MYGRVDGRMCGSSTTGGKTMDERTDELMCDYIDISTTGGGGKKMDERADERADKKVGTWVSSKVNPPAVVPEESHCYVCGRMKTGTNGLIDGRTDLCFHPKCALHVLMSFPVH